MKKSIKYLGCGLIILIFSSFFTQPITSFYGEFRAIKMMNYNDTALSSTVYHSMVYLYNSPQAFFSPVSGINKGTVKLNNRPLYFEPAIRCYLDSADRKTNQGLSWELSNSDNSSNFSFTCLSTYPVYSGFSDLPNLISKTTNLHLHFTNLSGADEIEFTIDDLQLHISSPWYRKVSSSLNNIEIPKTHLCGLSGSIVTMRITFIKNEEKVINGKTYKFENRLNINKLVALVN